MTLWSLFSSIWRWTSTHHFLHMCLLNLSQIRGVRISNDSLMCVQSQCQSFHREPALAAVQSSQELTWAEPDCSGSILTASLHKHQPSQVSCAPLWLILANVFIVNKPCGMEFNWEEKQSLYWCPRGEERTRADNGLISSLSVDIPHPTPSLASWAGLAWDAADPH